MNCGLRDARTALLAAAAAIQMLSGCAELMLVSSATALVKGLPSNDPHWVETNQLLFDRPVAEVYELTAREAERNERKIVERDEPAHSLRVSYPFSWMKNNWGGTIRITCTPVAAGTQVTIEGDGRDAVTRVRAIGDEILRDLDRALRQQPRTL